MKYSFPKNFLWGAATSGIQSEGTTNQVNESIWELWYKKEPSRFINMIGPEKVCDTYNKYLEDVELMKNINLNSLRTSIQWSRLISDFETGEVCADAVRFYNNYFDAMIESGIEPIINLYHFDMPAELQIKYGGFESKKVIELYEIYVKKAFELFGNKIKFWTTFNEPIVPVEGGYLYDFHYPNKKDPKLAVQVAFNTLVAHARAVKAYRNLNLTGKIGIVLNLTPTYPKSEKNGDINAAEMADLFFNRSFLDPTVKGEFPLKLIEVLAQHKLLPEYSQVEKEDILTQKIDFLGVNYYVPRRVQEKNKKDIKFENPEFYFDYYLNPDGRFNPFRDNNEIFPVAVYDIAKNIQKNYDNIPWYIAEIGIAMDLDSEGSEIEGIIDDSFRTELLKEHLVELHRAIKEGSNCFGFHMWTFIDCWSWTNSFKRRYGFYRLDLESGKRIIKKNAIWFSKLVEANGF